MIKNELLPEMWTKSLELACEWLIDKAMIKTPAHGLSGSKFRFLDEFNDWQGAFRGEYNAARRKWDIFCPIWHGGQAVKALASAYEATGRQDYLAAAKQGAGFILRHQIRDKKDPDFGLMLGYESGGSAGVNTSAILECVDGLFELSRLSGDEQYTAAAIDALYWVQRTMYVHGTGLYHSDYNPKTRSIEQANWMKKYNRPDSRRPHLDDGSTIRAYQITGDRSFLDMSIESANYLLQCEDPAGNWKSIVPCCEKTGVMHPRQTYWFARPMWMLFKLTGEQKYLNCCRRGAMWYVRAMRRDGGLFRDTDLEFKTPSFGHENSGIACAGILWLDLIREFDDIEWIEPLKKAVSFLRSVQFVQVSDENLKGAVLEKVLAPNGSDAPPWYLRDLGTIFYTTLLSRIMLDFPVLLSGDVDAIRDSWTGNVK